MAHENGGWMNDDQRSAMRDAASKAASNQYVSGGICPACGAHNQIVNECGCDKANLPTPAPTREVVDEQAEWLNERAERAYRLRRERFALAVFREMVRREEGSKLFDWKPLAQQAVEAADHLEAALYPDAGPILPEYVP